MENNKKNHNKYWRFLAIAAIVLIIGIIAVRMKLYVLAALLIALDLFSTYFERKFGLEPGPDFLLCGVIIYGYTSNMFFAYSLLPFTLFSKILFGRFKLRHLLKPLIFFFCALAAKGMSGFPILFVGVSITVFRYGIEYAFDAAVQGQLPADRIIPRALRVLYSYVFFLVLGNLLLGAMI
jgi:hypothetical protein